jgi:hypothetical protein
MKAEITNLVKRPRKVRGRIQMECWGAETTDGIWAFEREDDTSTLWLVFHKPSLADGSCPLQVRICGKLEDCQEYVTKPEALTDLAELQARFAPLTMKEKPAA